ncbi:hypothetical protein LSH36_28g07049 [Paralvinella palmiformis]|uniref:Endothelin-converting enzyme 1 n=1 Tax=Paralvinella palmiformis TaxID=53620 RepID=A0AAD9K9R9_9ANNE|nr:hypothetical protein LSH36_28g07049 [Paralvinella palmiformis]
MLYCFLILYKDEAGSGDQQHKTMNKLCILMVISLIVITGLLIVIMVLSLSPDEPLETCQSPGCVMTAGSMLSRMQLSANPCDDFYAYACNAAIQDPTIPPSASRWGVIEEVDDKNKAIMKRLLEKPGSEYKGVNSTAVEKAKFYFAACMNATARETRTKKRLLQFDQGGTCLTNPDFYAANDSLPYHNAFVKLFISITTLLGANETLASKIGEDVWQFEQDLANAFDKPEQRLDPEESYHKMSLSNLQGLLGSDVIDLHKYLRKALNMSIAMTEEVIVYAVDYIPKMAALVQAADKETLASYMVWHVIITLLPYMPIAYRMPLLEFESTLSGVSASENMWEDCVSHTESSFGFATGALFVEENFSKQDKQDVTDILSEIRQTFVHNLPSVTWMDTLTRHRAMVKADGIIQKIGYPEFIKDPAKLDDYYAKVTIHANSQFRNVLNVRFFQVQFLIDKLGTAPDRNEWHMTPETVNAYYSPSLNEIVFPAGILQKPIYDRTVPRSLLFGGIGMVMGHELSHAFDNQGRLYDIHGNMRNWWTNHSAEAFIKRTQCFIDEYDTFTISGNHINGKTTLSENIADNVGLKTAYNAYKSWSAKASYRERPLPGLNMTDEQMFFLSFSQISSYVDHQLLMWRNISASLSSFDYTFIVLCGVHISLLNMPKLALVTDSHTNNKFRVIGSLRNMPEFAEAYHCTAASPMNPANKCSLW